MPAPWFSAIGEKDVTLRTMNEFYREYGDYLAERFEGKVQKLTIDTGASCPNRDGTLGRGGCVYCSNAAFSPMAGLKASVAEQLARSKEFFSRKYPNMRYLAYFQSHTATHAGADTFVRQCAEAASFDGVVGLIVGTRPDCMPEPLLKFLEELNGRIPVMVEYGMESACDATLRRINRCHTHAQTAEAVHRTTAAGIDTGVHLIFGLPGEDDAEMMRSVDAVNELPVKFVKFHQLQIVRGTRLAKDVASGRETVKPFGIEEYIDLCCRVIARLRKDIAIDRFTAQCPADMLVAPRWGLKNHEFTARLQRRLRELANSRR